MATIITVPRGRIRVRSIVGLPVSTSRTAIRLASMLVAIDTAWLLGVSRLLSSHTGGRHGPSSCTTVTATAQCSVGCLSCDAGTCLTPARGITKSKGTITAVHAIAKERARAMTNHFINHNTEVGSNCQPRATTLRKAGVGGRKSADPTARHNAAVIAQVTLSTGTCNSFNKADVAV
jgi:hypothetical protein